MSKLFQNRECDNSQNNNDSGHPCDDESVVTLTRPKVAWIDSGFFQFTALDKDWFHSVDFFSIDVISDTTFAFCFPTDALVIIIFKKKKFSIVITDIGKKHFTITLFRVVLIKRRPTEHFSLQCARL